jgi:5'-3' exonuclease
MRELEKEIRIRFPYAILSSTQEPGEGEHKIFTEMKKTQRKRVCIYGLDADLILLSMFNSLPDFVLLRESSEFGDDETEFSVLSIPRLTEQLPIPIDQYLALCVLCFGNDFMPNLGMFSLREDGYARALNVYKRSGADLNTEEGRYKFLSLAKKEEIPVLEERVKLRRRPYEKAILGKNTSTFSKQYNLHILDGVQNIEPVIESFWKTFHWTMHYFKTNEVLDWDWVYPYADAPLVQDLTEFYETQPTKTELKFNIRNQLQFILPSKSLRKAKRRVLYQDEFYSETRLQWMKRHDWEVKPYMSLPWTNVTSICLH